MRVMPSTEGFEVYLIVHKELEDVSQPEFSNVGYDVRRHDGSLPSFRPRRGLPTRTLGWIPLGRDQSLEQEMLRQLRARLYESSEQHMPPI